jgi:hypothetical protein
VALPRELRQPREVQPPEAAREDPDGQEEVGATRHPPRATSRDPPGGQDTMEMGVMVELLAPGVEHGEAADLRPERLRVPGDVLEGLGDGAKEQTIEGTGVLQRQGPQGVRQGKDPMDVGRLEHLLLPGSQPRSLRGTMACGAAAVPAGILRLACMPTMVALGDMAAQGGGATERDGA